MHSIDSVPKDRVLVAESSPGARFLLNEWLCEWGYLPQFIDDGIDAWEALQKDCAPKLVILNQSLPRLSTLDLCRKLRAASCEALPFIVVLAARKQPNGLACALDAGADAYLSWPIAKNDLRARLCAAGRLIGRIDHLIDTREDLRIQATCDSLTGVWNRRAFLEMLQGELEFAGRSHSTSGLLLLDMDRFKRINDTYGHLAGDAVLRETANRLRRNIRPYDFVGRFGGEEFLVAIRGCDRTQLREQAERLRLAVSNAPVMAGRCEIWTTVSIGAAIARPGDKATAALIAAADAALYQAKKAGRNRTVNYEKPCKVRLNRNTVSPESRPVAARDGASPAAPLVAGASRSR